MKKTLLVVLAIVLAVAMLVACGAPKDNASASPAASESAATSDEPASSDQASAGDKPLVGISVPNNPTGWVGAVQWSAKKTADELGLNYILAASENVNDQANKIDELIQQKCEYIVLFPANDELAVAAQKILDAGIVLVNFDRTLGDVQPDYYVAGDNGEMGRLGAQYIVDKLKEEGIENGKVAIMNIPNYGSIFKERVDGAKEVFDKNSNIEIIGEWASDDGAPETVLPVMTDILNANDHIDAIYSTDDEMSKGILQAIKEANRTDIKVITGGGGDKSYFAMMDEFTDMWVSSQTYPPYMMADCLKLVDGLINGKTYESKVIIPPVNVDRTNYKQFMADYGITEDAPY